MDSSPNPDLEGREIQPFEQRAQGTVVMGQR